MIEVLITKFGAEEASGISALGLDKQAFIVQLVTFLLVFYILNKFVFGKVVNLLERRRRTIEEGVRLTTEMQAEKEKLDDEIAKVHQEARKQADAVIAASREQASDIIKQAEESARQKADRILADAREKITEETVKAKRTLEEDMVDLIISTSEKVTRERLTAEKDRSLISKFLKEQA
ncbi:MAG TPA: F0F1 ATP synthase subunit B [Candidatus Saccharimonadales bacterium]|nr:F0F1 ATP synthase subunit B [Candidatus Saccharimonadales bacterium]